MARPRKEAGKKTVRQNISIYPEQLEQVQNYCQEEERSISWVVRQALKEYLCKVAQENK